MTTPANLDPNQPQIVSNYEKFIGYVSKGAQIGEKTLAAEKRDSRMRELVKAPNTATAGDKLSLGAKVVNFVYLGMIALPALGGYKLTGSVIKYFENRAYDKAKSAQGKLLYEIDALFKNQLHLEAQIVECNRDIDLTTQKIIEYPQITTSKEKLSQLESKLIGLKENLKDVKAKTEEKYNKLELEDNKLRTSTILRAKEHLFAQRKAIEGVLEDGYVGEGANRVFIPEIDNDLKTHFQNLHIKLTDDYIKSQDNAIRDYETVLQLRGSSTFQSINQDPLLVKTQDLSNPQIEDLIKQHKTAKREMLEFDGVVEGGDPNIQSNFKAHQRKENIERILNEIQALNTAKQYEEVLMISYEHHHDQAEIDVTNTLGQPENDDFLKVQQNIEIDIERSQAKIAGLEDQIRAKTEEYNEALDQLKNIDRPVQALLTPREKIDGLMKKINEIDIQLEQLINIPTRGIGAEEAVDEAYKKLSADLEQAERDLNKVLSTEIEVTANQLSKTEAALIENKNESNRNLLEGWKGKDMGAHLTAEANLKREITHLTQELNDYKFVQTQLWSRRRDFDPEAIARFNEGK